MPTRIIPKSSKIRIAASPAQELSKVTRGEKSVLSKTLKSPGNSDETSEPLVLRIAGAGGLGVPPKIFRVHNRPCLFEQFLRRRQPPQS